MDGFALAVLGILTVALGGLLAAVVTLQVSTRDRVDVLADRLAEGLAALAEQLGAVRGDLAALSARFEDHEHRVSR